MHFFIDNNLLTSQDNQVDYAFGTDRNDPANKFNITSRFCLNTPTKAFACQDSLMIVQQSSVDSSLVNVILKPIEGLKIPFKSVKYFVYRGLLKDSFINGANVTPQAIGNSEFIAKFWETWNNYKGEQNLPDPTPESFGYDNSLAGSLAIENIYDNSQESVRPLFVKEGEWIGNFGSTFEIGLEIITEDDNLTLDLDFLRAEKFQINVTNLSGLALKAEREKILSFIDPAAFFGLHYEEGIKVSTYSGTVKTTEKKKKDELYTSIISKFDNKNCVYLDIRSEKGYSYNFYQNYDDGLGNNIKIGNNATTPVVQTYGYNSWPIAIIKSPINTTANKNDIKINLRIDDNTKPILFFENTKLISDNNNSHFIEDNKILGGTNDWSKDLNFFFPNTENGASKNNVAYYIQLHYFRQEHNPTYPNTVLKNENYFDTVFCPIDLPHLADVNYIFQMVFNSDLNFVRGQLPSINKTFGYIAESRTYWDNDRVLFYSQEIFQTKSTGSFLTSFKNNGFDTGFNLTGSYNRMSFLTKNIRLTQKKVQENIGGVNFQQVKLLDITNSNDIHKSYESILCLGITQAELLILKNLSGFSNLHYRYIYIEEVTGSPFMDKDNKPFMKYKLGIQGLDNNGDRIIVNPTTDIYVYSNSGIIFTSKAFAEQEINQQGLAYIRNYEENVGYINKEKTTNKLYEDYFIEKNPNMNNKVNTFVNSLNNVVDNTPNTYSNIKTLVENSAQGIWNEAVSFVQANNNVNPDDRPLYWARNKMEVALKNHLYFKGQFASSEVLNESDLDVMIKLFEEKSRNYTGVDFSGAPTGAKKILITGFDPFFLNEKHPIYGQGSNFKQSNPSGVCALALHGQNLGNGYIQTMIVPVKYTDFDSSNDNKSGQGEGIIEKHIKPWLNEVDMIITISQAAPNQYNIDVFATATRGGTIDNMNFTREEGSKSVNTSSPETIVTTLPDEFTQGSSHAIFNGEYQQTKYGATLIATKNNYPTTKVFNGPGGNYLSNEIFYRVAKLRKELRPSLPTGHFHIAMLQNAGEDFSVSKTQTLLNIVKNAVTNGITGI